MKKQITIGVVAIIVVAVLIAAVILIWTRSKSNYTPVYLTEAEQKQILTQIAKNNDQAVLKNTLAQAGAPAADTKLAAGATAMSNSAISILPYFEPNTYRESTSTFTKGPAANKCPGLTTYIEDGTSEYYSYTGDTFAQNYSKTIAKDNNGNILNIYVGQSEPNLYTSYEYIGGSYAIKTATTTNNTANVPSPAVISPAIPEETPVTTPSLEDIYGTNVEITGKYTQNGQDFYVIRFTQPSYCDQQAYLSVRSTISYQETPSVDLYLEQSINAATYELAEAKTYLQNYNPENLIITYNYKNSSQTGNIAQFSQKFDFPTNIQVKTVNIQDPSVNLPDYANQVYTKLVTLGADIFTLNNGTEITNISVSDDSALEVQKLRLNKDFYPKTAKGEDEYNQATSFSNETGLAYINHTVGSVYTSTTIYNSSVSNESVVGIKDGDAPAKSKPVVIAGINATAYFTENTYTNPAYIQDDGTNVPESTSTFASYVVILEKNNLKYVIYLSGTTVAEIEALILKSPSFLPISSPATKDLVTTIVTNSYNAPIAVDGPIAY